MAESVTWTAQWIWDETWPRAIPAEHSARYFRRVFQAPAPGETAVVHVSASTRYRLYVNGRPLLSGPCKGSPAEHYYETVDIGPYLHDGANVIAARVVHFAPVSPRLAGVGGPLSVFRAPAGGFLLQGAGLDTGTPGWKVWRDESVTWVVQPRAHWMGETEAVEGARRPHGWMLPGYDDAAWAEAVPFSRANSVGGRFDHGHTGVWPLHPRPIPLLYERERSLLASPLQVAAGETRSLTIDAGELLTAYLEVEVEGSGTLSLLSSEAYEPKGRRDEATGRTLAGVVDTYRAGGGLELYEPFWFRTFRFLRLDVTGPLTVSALSCRETGYPLEVAARFDSSDKGFGPIWSISLRTLQRCMHETYEDCPFYEQLQYTLDTRLEALYTYAVSGDDRMGRRAIHDFHSSLLPEGLLQSRYPSYEAQVIPGFALHWIFMIGDHWRWFGDPALVRRYRATVDAVLDWFDRRIGPSGLVGPVPHWDFMDWVAEWRQFHGQVPAGQVGPNVPLNLLYSAALQEAAVLAEAHGRSQVAGEYRDRASRINEAVNGSAWSEAEALYRDGPGVDQYSQHGQVWAVLAGAAPDPGGLMDRMLDRPDLPKCSWPHMFFLFRALARTGRWDRSWPLWDGWREMVDLNLTTWVEDPVQQRSDCHGWSAVPLHELLTEVLGVQPAAPGCARVRVEPKPGPLSFVEGSVPTPRGPVHVSWRNGRLSVSAPPGIAVQIIEPASR